MVYDFKLNEEKFRNAWNNQSCFKVDLKKHEKKWYVLEMFPYPSGKIHMGHARNYTIGDALARYRRAQGFNVLHPIGWDAFGLPAENAAIEKDLSPSAWTKQNIANMKSQLEILGLSYDWDRELATADPDYYQHEQKFFIEMVNMGVAYQKESYVNWDPVDNTVLANEQVVNGRGWRSGALIEKRKLKQWFLKISDFAEDLLNDAKELTGWPQKVIKMQEQWIGKSTGAEITFQTTNPSQNIVAFTTRPETIFGAKFCAIAPDHHIATIAAEQNQDLNNFIQQCMKEEDRVEHEKIGYLLDIKAINPINNEEIPVYVVNYVKSGYGTGAIFGCPAHDERDKEFALKYDITPTPVINEDQTNPTMINSGFLDGKTTTEARQQIIDSLQKSGQGQAKTTYKLRDWGISRQRKWGCPIPIIHCDSCGAVAEDINKLPVRISDNLQVDKQNNCLTADNAWHNTHCPKCGKQASRETDTFDTFFESSWYYAAFCSPDKNIDRECCNHWLPVDEYIGGIEHAVMHLLYARFITKLLTKMGYFSIKEPFKHLITQGMVCHKTYKDPNTKNWITPEAAALNPEAIEGPSEKMSKSKHNIVEPLSIIQQYGTDTARLFILSDNPPEIDMEWSSQGIEGSWKFINKFWNYVENHTFTQNIQSIDMPNETSGQLTGEKHKMIQDTTAHIDGKQLNRAIASIRTFFNFLSKHKDYSEYTQQQIQHSIAAIARLIEPFTPHLAEAVWEKIGGQGLLVKQPWPSFNKTFTIQQNTTIAVQVNGKLRDTFSIDMDAADELVLETALQSTKVKNLVENKEIKKTIIIKNKLINIIAV